MIKRMTITLYKIYGIGIGLISLLFGIVLIFLKKLDATLADNESTAKDIKTKRTIIAMFAILCGLMSLYAVLLGWPPVRGYIIPPP
jgi:hypothetical protein